MKPTKPTRGRPSGEPTKQIRVYTTDVPLLCRKGETQAEAVRRLIGARAKPKAATPDTLRGKRFPADIYNAETGEIIYPFRRVMTVTLIKRLAANEPNLACDDVDLLAAVRWLLRKTK